jgi:molybdenum cofactor cytidylyltransferase
MLPVKGRPLVSQALAAALAGEVSPLVIVIGPPACTPPALDVFLRDQARASGGGVRVVRAAAAARGQAESLKAGLKQVLRLAPEAPGVMVLLGDMPLVGAKLVRALQAAFQTEAAAGNPAVVAPVFQGRRGHPVIIPAGLFTQVLALRGDQGARGLLAGARLGLVPWPDDSCLVDVDTPDDYDCLATRISSPDG